MVTGAWAAGEARATARGRGTGIGLGSSRPMPLHSALPSGNVGCLLGLRTRIV